MNVALVYDRVNKFGGAEQILLQLHRLWPKAPLFTAVYAPEAAPWANVFEKVVPSFLQSWPKAKRHHEFYPWLTPLAFEGFDFSTYDLVISVTSAEAKAIITPPATKHICYCLTPTRYLWSHRREYLREPGLGRWLGWWLKRLQADDLVYAQRPDAYIAISQTVKKRIKQYYGRDSTVIYPPVDTAKFSKITNYKLPINNYFLIVSRLVNYKNIDLAITVFNRLRLPLVIVGQGREAARLKRLAGPTVVFAGGVNDAQLVAYYQHCRALVMPQEEDFGLTAVEAMAAGKPVIALNRGGVTETVINRKTGLLFNQVRVDSLASAMKQFDQCLWQPELIRMRARQFDQKIFIQQWRQYR
jgi:glycosyltransferase involved in cell wall biosynthesis